MLFPFRRIRPAAVILVLGLIAFAALLAGCRSPDLPPPAMELHAAPAIAEVAPPTPARPPQPERQIYLADGGAGLVMLQPSTTGTSAIEGWWVLSFPEVRWNAELETTGPQKRLRVQAMQFLPFAKAWDGVVLLFHPSTARADDWDLVYADSDAAFANSEELEPDFRIPVPDPLPPVAPISSFLHRLDDDRAVDYFRLAAASDPFTTPSEPGSRDASRAGTSVTRELLRLARELVAAHPDDLHARYLLLDALLRSEKRGELAAELLLFEAQVATSGSQLLEARGRMVRRQVEGNRLEENGLNGRRPMEKLLARTTRPDERLRLTADLFRYATAITTVPTVIQPGRNRAIQTNMLEEQTVCKVNRVYADFCMLTGQRDQERTLLVGMFRAAQLYGHNPDQGLIRQLIATAMRSITAAGLQTLAANACLTPAETTALWQDLELLNSREYELQEDDQPHWVRWLKSPEPQVRHGVASARFQLVRMTLAARWHQMVGGRLPISASQITPLFPAGLPRDPFTSAPLRVEASQEGVNLYSLGPDRMDQFAAVEYDPTNGTISAGDLVARVPAAREYPFPAEGMRAWSVQDVARQFPKGLPPDPFADTRGRGYTVTSGPGPVIVYSFGPDTNESEVFSSGVPFRAGHLSQAPHVPTTVYDPTNGVVSRGTSSLSCRPTERGAKSGVGFPACAPLHGKAPEQERESRNRGRGSLAGWPAGGVAG